MARRSLWSPLGVALLCGHCALTGALALVGLLGAGATPLLFGVDVDYVWPPVLLLGLFGFLVWGSRSRRADEGASCAAEPAAGPRR